MDFPLYLDENDMELRAIANHVSTLNMNDEGSLVLNQAILSNSIFIQRGTRADTFMVRIEDPGPVLVIRSDHRIIKRTHDISLIVSSIQSNDIGRYLLRHHL